MKAKDLKILRKNLAKLNKADNDPLDGIAQELCTIAPPPNVDSQTTKKNKALFVTAARSADISAKKFGSMLSLFERNMGEMYKNSSWGLDAEEKAQELRHPNARFLLVETSSSPSSHGDDLAGFVHFRFDYDDDEQPTEGVVYVYEIQIDEQFQRQGLGKRLMDLAEQMASKAELAKVMLTVFKSNQSAMSFYQRIDYGIDPSSPSKHNEPADYEILSKTL